MDKNKLLKKYLWYDFLASLLVWTLFMIFRKTVNDAQLIPGVEIFVPRYDFYTGFIFFPVSCLFIHYLSGYYLRPLKFSSLETAFTTLVSSAIISISIFFVLMLDDIVFSYRYYYYSLLVLFSLLFFVTYFFRNAIYKHYRKKIENKEWTINTLVVGTGEKALQTAKNIDEKDKYYNFKGYVSLDFTQPQLVKEKWLGPLQKIETIILQNNIRDIVIALDEPDEQQLFQIINSLYKYNIDIRFTPRLYEILTGGAKIRMLGVDPLVNITELQMPAWQFSVKRFSDILLSVITLIAILPVLIYFMIAVKLDSKGPVFYLQERIGYLGKPFNIIKFRTMYVDSENGVPQLSSPYDDRITRIGRMLRKYRIDELPQLWNIIKGDMSIVGPRPERKFYIDQIIEQAPYYCLLYKIRPGLTSWGPIRIGYSDTIEKMIERLNYDIIYIEKMSLFTDFKILLQTIEIVFKGKGI